MQKSNRESSAMTMTRTYQSVDGQNTMTTSKDSDDRVAEDWMGVESTQKELRTVRNNEKLPRKQWA